MEKDLKMTGTDYNLSLTIFFISYALFEPLTNALLKKIRPRVFFTSIILAWGLIMTLMGVVKNFQGLLAARFFLGVAEAGLFPGVNYYLSCWYKGSELGVRSSLFFSAAALAGSFGGLLAAAISRMKGIGGLTGWAWIFIIEGVATMVVGIICYWFVYDWPATAQFLSPEDRIRAQRRIILAKQGRTAEDFDKRHIFAALSDWKSYLYMLIYQGCLIPLYAFSLFLPTIIAGIGYKGTHAQLLTVPPYACAAVLTPIVGYIGDKTQKRGYLNMATVSIGIIGFILLLASGNPHIQYAGTFLGAMGIYPCIPNTLSWVSNNTEGNLKRGFALGMIVGWGNLNGVVSSNIYLVKEKPRFRTGHSVVLASQIVLLLGGSIAMHVLLRLENSRRRAGKRDNLLTGMSEEEIAIAGDKRPDFFYKL